MTNSWTDIKNTKLALVFSNPAENHPGVMQWVNEARANGAKMIVVDPRKTRTAALADTHLRIRPGTDIALMNGVLKYIFDNNKADTTYLSGKTDAGKMLNAGRTDYVGTDSSTGSTRATAPKDAPGGLNDPDSVLTYLKNRVTGYTAAEVAKVCGCTEDEFTAVANAIADSKAMDSKPMTILYAMGTTQHSYGSQMVRSLAVLQTVLGNVGKPGAGINAMRGIHNVQGSTDMGVLFDGMPGYSSPPKVGQTYGQYMDRLFGAVKDSTYEGYGKVGSAGDHWRGWQQVGFRSMMHHFFNQTGSATPLGGSYLGENEADHADSNFDFDVMPKGNGDNHRAMFEKAAAGTIKAMFIFGQNPAVTEANCDDVRKGLYELDLLVVTDVFKTETAAISRKAGTRTWLLPSASFVERPGSVTNSSRCLQWRGQAIAPKNNCKADAEILMRLAKALDTAGAFSHITGTASWTANHAGQSAYQVLYNSTAAADSGYGWDGVAAFNATTVYLNIYKQICSWIGQTATGGTVWIYGAAYNPSGGKYGSISTAVSANSVTLNTGVGDTTASDYAAGTIVEVGGLSNVEFMTVQSYAAGVVTFTGSLTKTHAVGEPITPRGYYSYHAWSDKIIAKSRAAYDPFDNGLYPRWGFAWLVNRRNFYNYNPCNITSGGSDPTREGVRNPDGSILYANAATGNGNRWTPGYITWCKDSCPHRPGAGDGTCNSPGDARDFFVASDNKARLFVHYKTDVPYQYPDPVPAAATAVFRYRAYSVLAEADGRTPKHWEPWESPSAALVAAYGNVGDAPIDPIGDRATYPLTMTTYRNTEHFQGGPTTRNIPWLNELVPDPVVELNSKDAAPVSGGYPKCDANGVLLVGNTTIDNGDKVWLSSARAGNVGPFIAAVGSGLKTNQRVGEGVVAIPWHWGEVGLNNSTAVANRLTIDALDANTKMPETKVCLCKIAKVCKAT